MHRRSLWGWVVIGAVAVGGGLAVSGPAMAQRFPVPEKRKVQKTDAEWRKQLTPMQYFVSRQKGTEQPGTGIYAHTRKAGTYRCVGCDAPLFSSRTKFESGTGWPSFYRPISERAIDREADYSQGSLRVEVLCHDCGGHLGHVFEDGPLPTGLRYCMNSASLRFVPDKAPVSKTKAVRGKTTRGNPPETPADGPSDGKPDGNGPGH